jgi:hypothetical protein
MSDTFWSVTDISNKYKGTFSQAPYQSGILIIEGSFADDKNNVPVVFGLLDDEKTKITLCGLVWSNKTNGLSKYDVLSYQFGAHDEKVCIRKNDYIGG